MTQAAKDVLQAALALPAEDRAELLDELIVARDEADPSPLSAEWMAEIERRSADFDAGLVQRIPWEEVKRRVREQGRPRG